MKPPTLGVLAATLDLDRAIVKAARAAEEEGGQRRVLVTYDALAANPYAVRALPGTQAPPATIAGREVVYDADAHAGQLALPL